MGKKRAKQAAPIAVEPHVGRWRAAWLVLMGQRLLPQQMQSEWSLIQASAADMFNKFNTLAARLVKAERRALEKSLVQPTPTETTTPGVAGRKAELRTRLSISRGLRSPTHVDGDQGREGTVSG